jgi:hypothetical protein
MIATTVPNVSTPRLVAATYVPGKVVVLRFTPRRPNVLTGATRPFVAISGNDNDKTNE